MEHYNFPHMVHAYVTWEIETVKEKLGITGGKKTPFQKLLWSYRERETERDTHTHRNIHSYTHKDTQTHTDSSLPFVIT